MTNSINAIATSTRVNHWLHNSLAPRVLHIFDRACNLVNEHSEVLSLVTPEIGHGPFNLVIEDHLVFTDHIRRESSVYNAPSELHIGNLIIQAHRAKSWNAHPDWESLHLKRQAILEQSKVLHSLQSPISNLQSSDSLSSSLAIADIDSSVTSAKKLAGLGEGLTPSGDDYLMGALYAAWIIHPQEVAAHIAREIANIAAPLTTTLSGAWLRSAASGEAGILWHAFFESLVGGEPDAIQNRVSNILAVGASSGTDAMAGFINTLIAFTEIDNKYVIS